jgi:hypothetical protein
MVRLQPPISTTTTSTKHDNSSKLPKPLHLRTLARPRHPRRNPHRTNLTLLSPPIPTAQIMVLLDRHHRHPNAKPRLHRAPRISIQPARRSPLPRILADDLTRALIPRCRMLHSI